MAGATAANSGRSGEVLFGAGHIFFAHPLNGDPVAVYRGGQCGGRRPIEDKDQRDLRRSRREKALESRARDAHDFPLLPTVPPYCSALDISATSRRRQHLRTYMHRLEWSAGPWSAPWAAARHRDRTEQPGWMTAAGRRRFRAACRLRTRSIINRTVGEKHTGASISYRRKLSWLPAPPANAKLVCPSSPARNCKRRREWPVADSVTSVACLCPLVAARQQAIFNFSRTYARCAASAQCCCLRSTM